MPDLIVTVNLPPHSISPNRSGVGNWRKFTQAKRKYRQTCGDFAFGAKHESRFEHRLEKAAIQVYRYYNKGSKESDPDNLIAHLKPAFDSLVDAGILSDDKKLIHLPPVQKLVTGKERIELHIWGSSEDWLEILVSHIRKLYQNDTI